MEGGAQRHNIETIDGREDDTEHHLRGRRDASRKGIDLHLHERGADLLQIGRERVQWQRDGLNLQVRCSHSRILGVEATEKRHEDRREDDKQQCAGDHGEDDLAHAG